jgi:pimeloyl-ACP methyl ester carboxylesterase
MRQVPVGQLVFDILDTGGDGDPVLLLHGFPQSSHSWRLVVPHLRDYRVVAPDQRGYSPGARPLDVEDYRLPRLVEDALGLLDALGIDRAHVVGHDWGAAVAWQLGARHPDRVRTLTAVSVPHPRAFVEALRTDDDQRARSLYMRDFARPSYAVELLADDAATLRTLFGESPSAVDVEGMVRAARQPGALDAWLRWYAAQRLEDIGDTPAVTVPTMHVWSDQDRALGRAGAEGTAAWCTGPYRFEVLPGVSHWVPEEAADDLAGLLLPHLVQTPG